MRYIAAVGAMPLFLLAACSGEPSSSDIQKAMQAKEDAVGALLGVKSEITSVDKNKCEKTDGGRFRCSFTATGKAGGNEANLELSRVFEKMNSGWVVVGE